MSIAAERERQMTEEGYDDNTDQDLVNGELVAAAIVYATSPDDRQFAVAGSNVPHGWPWGHGVFKPSPDDRRRELVKAGALIAAEIDRLDNIPATSFRKREECAHLNRYKANPNICADCTAIESGIPGVFL